MPNPATAPMLAILALATAGLGARTLVPSVGDAIARRVAHLTAALQPPAGSAEATTDTDAVLSPAEQPLAESREEGRGGVRSQRSKTKATPAGALDIPADRVARLTAKQLRSLRASDAVDAGGHAIGARLSGVGALGLGLADGDVVTSIDGRPTPDVITATAAAMQAYASGEAAAHATLLRSGRTLLVTVHIPAKDATRKG